MCTAVKYLYGIKQDCYMFMYIDICLRMFCEQRNFFWADYANLIKILLTFKFMNTLSIYVLCVKQHAKTNYKSSLSNRFRV